jgi:hypothetical protein
MMFLFTVIIFVVTLQPEKRKQYMQFHRFTVLIFMILGAIFISFSSIASSSYNHFDTASDTNDIKVLWLLKNAENHPRVLRWTVFPAYNDNDGMMAGLVLTNDNGRENKKFSYALAPMFSFLNSKLTGEGRIVFNNIVLNKGIDKISYGIGIKSYDYNRNEKFDYSLRFIRVDPRMTIHFTDTDTRKSKVTLKLFFISEENPVFDKGQFKGLSTEYSYIPRMDYDYSNHDDYQGTDMKLSIEYQGYNSEKYIKMTGIADQKYRFAEKKHLYFRAFLSGFLWNTQRQSNSFQNVFTRGSIALIHQGFNDYTYEETFLSRQNQTGFQNDQISMTSGGGFKTPVGSAHNIGMSNHLAASVGFSSDIPFRLPKWIPLRAYFDIGTYSIYGIDKFTNTLLYNGGLSLHYKDIGAIYFPLFYSENLGNIYKSEHKTFLSRISFSLNLNKIAIGKLPGNVL